MMLMHLMYVLSLSMVFYAAQEEAPMANTKAELKAELIEGPWETTTASGIDGIFLSTSGVLLVLRNRNK